MAVKDRFLQEARVGEQVELVCGPKEIAGTIVWLDQEIVQVKKEDGRTATVDLAAIRYYEMLNEPWQDGLPEAVESGEPWQDASADAVKSGQPGPDETAEAVKNRAPGQDGPADASGNGKLWKDGPADASGNGKLWHDGPTDAVKDGQEEDGKPEPGENAGGDVGKTVSSAKGAVREPVTPAVCDVSRLIEDTSVRLERAKEAERHSILRQLEQLYENALRKHCEFDAKRALGQMSECVRQSPSVRARLCYIWILAYAGNTDWAGELLSLIPEGEASVTEGPAAETKSAVPAVGSELTEPDDTLSAIGSATTEPDDMLSAVGSATAESDDALSAVGSASSDADRFMPVMERAVSVKKGVLPDAERFMPGAGSAVPESEEESTLAVAEMAETIVRGYFSGQRPELSERFPAMVKKDTLYRVAEHCRRCRDFLLFSSGERQIQAELMKNTSGHIDITDGLVRRVIIKTIYMHPTGYRYWYLYFQCIEKKADPALRYCVSSNLAILSPDASDEFRDLAASLLRTDRELERRYGAYRLYNHLYRLYLTGSLHRNQSLVKQLSGFSQDSRKIFQVCPVPVKPARDYIHLLKRLDNRDDYIYIKSAMFFATNNGCENYFYGLFRSELLRREPVLGVRLCVEMLTKKKGKGTREFCGRIAEDLREAHPEQAKVIDVLLECDGKRLPDLCRVLKDYPAGPKDEAVEKLLRRFRDTVSQIAVLEKIDACCPDAPALKRRLLRFYLAAGKRSYYERMYQTILGLTTYAAEEELQELCRLSALLVTAVGRRDRLTDVTDLYRKRSADGEYEPRLAEFCEVCARYELPGNQACAKMFDALITGNWPDFFAKYDAGFPATCEGIAVLLSTSKLSFTGKALDYLAQSVRARGESEAAQLQRKLDAVFQVVTGASLADVMDRMQRLPESSQRKLVQQVDFTGKPYPFYAVPEDKTIVDILLELWDRICGETALCGAIAAHRSATAGYELLCRRAIRFYENRGLLGEYAEYLYKKKRYEEIRALQDGYGWAQESRKFAVYCAASLLAGDDLAEEQQKRKEAGEQESYAVTGALAEAQQKRKEAGEQESHAATEVSMEEPQQKRKEASEQESHGVAEILTEEQHRQQKASSEKEYIQGMTGETFVGVVLLLKKRMLGKELQRLRGLVPGRRREIGLIGRMMRDPAVPFIREIEEGYAGEDRIALLRLLYARLDDPGEQGRLREKYGDAIAECGYSAEWISPADGGVERYFFERKEEQESRKEAVPHQCSEPPAAGRSAGGQEEEEPVSHQYVEHSVTGFFTGVADREKTVPHQSASQLPTGFFTDITDEEEEQEKRFLKEYLPGVKPGERKRISDLYDSLGPDAGENPEYRRELLTKLAYLTAEEGDAAAHREYRAMLGAVRYYCNKTTNATKGRALLCEAVPLLDESAKRSTVALVRNAVCDALGSFSCVDEIVREKEGLAKTLSHMLTIRMANEFPTHFRQMLACAERIAEAASLADMAGRVGSDQKIAGWLRTAVNGSGSTPLFGQIYLTWYRLIREEIRKLSRGAVLMLQVETAQCSLRGRICCVLQNLGKQPAEHITVRAIFADAVRCRDSEKKWNILHGGDTHAFSFPIRCREEGIQKFRIVLSCEIGQIPEQTEYSREILLTAETEADHIGNLYSVAPVTSDAEFYGREREKKEILSFLDDVRYNTSMVMHGLKRVGKTSMLRYIERTMRGSGRYIPVYKSAQGIGEQNAVGRMFVETVAEELEAVGLMDDECRKFLKYDYDSRPEKLYEFYTYLQKSGLLGKKRILFMADEIEEIFDLVDEGRVSRRFYKVLRVILQELTSVRFIFCGADQLTDLLYNHALADVFEITKRVMISRLDEEAMRRMITEPAAGKLTYTDQALKRVWYYTRGHTFYSKHICSKVIDLLNEEGRDTAYAYDIDTAVRQVMRITEYFIYLSRFFRENDRQVIRLMCERIRFAKDRVSLDVLKDVYEGRGLMDTLAELEFKDILEKTEEYDADYYRFSIEMFRLWYAKAEYVTGPAG